MKQHSAGLLLFAIKVSVLSLNFTTSERLPPLPPHPLLYFIFLYSTLYHQKYKLCFPPLGCRLQEGRDLVLFPTALEAYRCMPGTQRTM
jgi:hypothetical protein